MSDKYSKNTDDNNNCVTWLQERYVEGKITRNHTRKKMLLWTELSPRSSLGPVTAKSIKLINFRSYYEQCTSTCVTSQCINSIV